MPSVKKIIDKMERQPNGIRMAEAHRVLEAYGFDLVRQKGSHRQYLNMKTRELITIKEKATLERPYVEDILKLVERKEADRNGKNERK